MFVYTFSSAGAFKRFLNWKPIKAVIDFLKKWQERLSQYTGYQYTTDILFYTFICCTSDMVEQFFENQISETKIDFSWDRNWKISATGITVGTICHLDYRLVEHLVPGDSGRNSVVKMLLNTAFSMPIEVFTFFFTLYALEGTFTREAFFNEVLEGSLKLYYTEFIAWPIFHIINFKFVKLEHRVMFEGVFSFCCDALASYFAYFEKRAHAK
ncbi:unnamed protein product [Orchesella dallaii]|uniref:Mpv17-like protein 2 n=1 Tax=Orchesella dallaii TaxID=48710 RepID=A0ABP1R586_9HEXA